MYDRGYANSSFWCVLRSLRISGLGQECLVFGTILGTKEKCVNSRENFVFS